MAFPNRLRRARAQANCLGLPHTSRQGPTKSISLDPENWPGCGCLYLSWIIDYHWIVWIIINYCKLSLMILNYHYLLMWIITKYCELFPQAITRTKKGLYPLSGYVLMKIWRRNAFPCLARMRRKLSFPLYEGYLTSILFKCFKVINYTKTCMMVHEGLRIRDLSNWHILLCRTTGLYTKTLARIIYRDITRFSVVFVIVFLGFCGAMYMALKATGSQELFR